MRLHSVGERTQKCDRGKPRGVMASDKINLKVAHRLGS